MKLSQAQKAALRELAGREDHTATVGHRPLNPVTLEKLADRGLVELWSKTVIGVQIRKATLSGAGAEAVKASA
jgi:hypothetical protein